MGWGNSGYIEHWCILNTGAHSLYCNLINSPHYELWYYFGAHSWLMPHGDGLWGGSYQWSFTERRGHLPCGPLNMDYYSSPKPKVTDAPMFYLLLKAPNKYLPDLTQWVMTEHPAWQIMLAENFKLCIFNAFLGQTMAERERPPSLEPCH